MQVTTIRGKIIHPHQRVVSVLVQIAGTWVYQITPEMQQHFLHLIAGMNTQQAVRTLLQFPGIAGAQITVKGGNRTLPQDPHRIQITILYRVV